MKFQGKERLNHSYDNAISFIARISYDLHEGAGAIDGSTRNGADIDYSCEAIAAGW